MQTALTPQHSSPAAGRHTVVPGQTVRLTTPIRAFGPLVLGLGVAVLARVLVDLEALAAFHRLADGTEFALVWILPVLLGALVSCTRTLWVQIGPSGVQVRRTLGMTRAYEPRHLIDWGFEHGPGTYTTMPPTEGRSVRFMFRTADGYSFEKVVGVTTAQRLSTLLLRGRLAGAPW